MNFRYSYWLHSIDFSSIKNLEISLPNNSTISFRMLAQTDKSKVVADKKIVGICETIIQKSPNERIKEIFNDLNADKIPSVIKHIEDKKTSHLFSISGYPQYYISFYKEIEFETDKITKEMFSLIRWRYDLKGSHNPFIQKEKEWSFDNLNWKILPQDSSIRVYLEVERIITNNDVADILAMFGEGKAEPLAHELFREAWSELKTNPKSSIVISIAALETSVKGFISNVIPKAEWLVRELQSPPVLKILSDFMPIITKESKLDKIDIPNQIFTNIKKGVFIRNEIVHGKDCNLKESSLKQILYSVKYMLYYLDYYQNNEWAKSHVRHIRANYFKDDN